MLRGEFYYSFGPEMSAARRRCVLACKRLNRAAEEVEEEDITRREQVWLWRRWASMDFFSRGLLTETVQHRGKSRSITFTGSDASIA